MLLCVKSGKNHIDKANKSRIQYHEDRDSANITNCPIFSADLQKVIKVPRMETFKSVVFTRRIIVFNESFVPIGKSAKHQAIAVLWHEAIAGRKKEDVRVHFMHFCSHIAMKTR